MTTQISIDQLDKDQIKSVSSVDVKDVKNSE